MSFQFLDAAYAQSVDQMDQALRHTGSGGFCAYIGGNNTSHQQDWPAAVIQGLLARGYQCMTIWVPWPASANGTADGQRAAAITRGLGLTFVALDLEAGSGQPASQPAAPGYSRAWLAAVKAAGCVAVGYSNSSGIIRNFAGYDRSWCATQGLANPCDPGHCPGPAGSRAVQCGYGSWAGVSYDVNVSEYDFGGGAATDPVGEEDLMKVVTATNIPAGYVDPHGSGACYVTNGVFKRYLPSAGELSAALGLAGQSAAQPYDQGSLDRIPEVVPVGFPGSAQLDVSALMAAVKELQGGFDIDALAQEISADLAALLPAGSSLSTEAIAAAVGDKLAQRLVS